MDSRFEIRLGGAGGQGLILAGIILAEAAIMDNKNAIQSQSYGPEARGGASKAEVIISEDEIDYPKVEQADLLLVLTKQACKKYIGGLHPDGMLIIDSTICTDDLVLPTNVVRVPILDTANIKINKPMVGNIVALGVIQQLTDIVTKDSLEKAVLHRVPRGTEELNKKALLEGYELVKNK
ncbi:pyruvate/ketoisovalerate oxidoreductase, gamma subunit [Alkaliphilus metalliredigens QYMF]|uniref:Pyruvate/ketoisovalerate oxidoreductase, gamma subunit n=1 Tax=Alkaliphilus metalliredigens (strain QYMF) TaxID=293826 RepID=A6TRG6_ALKMQ|nr:2-oxoacid:acceptor oxidoreductase family protein [Alkaliphilus metalliredigens]ABR48784.1 pyruvate/ketoisovalerate oxidoreductase, gamma subunit [Alkaliphilus metalliredigens QYMF]